MTKYYKIILSSGTKSFEISPDSGAHLVEGGLRGFDAAGFDVSTRSYASEAGGYIQKRRFAERELSLTFELSRDADPFLRRRIVSMLDSKNNCELDVLIGDIHRKITVIPCDEPKFYRPTFADTTEVTLYFVAPSVFFRAADESSSLLRNKSELLTFPMNFMADTGLTSGIYLSNGVGAVSNPGDGECGLTITIRAVGGEVENPSVYLGDLFIRCPVTLSDGDTLVIDTRPHLKNITLNGNRYFSFDKRSSFFSLPVGESELSVICSDGGEFAETLIEFTPIYYGV